MIRPSNPRNDEISFIHATNGMIAEVIWRPEQGLLFAIRNVDGKCEVDRKCDQYKPLHWLGDYARNGDVHLASTMAPYKSLASLAADIRAFIHRYSELDPVFESIATMFVLMTWLYDDFHAVPYLRFLGPPESGKTRSSETIGALCYRTTMIAGAATPAPMYHLIEAIGGTLLIDEADFRDSAVGADIIKVLNCGYQRGLSVKRMDKNEDGILVPRRYEVFGPKIINGRKRFDDNATETRCLICHSRPMTRTDIPVQLPSEFFAEAEALRNQLLTFRMKCLGKTKPSAERIPEISSRMNQIIAPLLTVAFVLPGTCYRDDLIAFARRSYSKAKVVASESAEAVIVQVLLDAPEGNILTCQDVCNMISEDGHFPDIGKWLKPRSVGRIVRDELGLETEHREKGTVIKFSQAQITELAFQYGLIESSAVSSGNRQP
jgi:hypothetical protein